MKTTVYTSSWNTCVCVILAHVDRMNTVSLITRPSWRQAVRMKPIGAHCRCCKPSASTPRAKEIGCLLASALEGKKNIYRESIQTEFLIINRLFRKVLVLWVQFECTICCQHCPWRDSTLANVAILKLSGRLDNSLTTQILTITINMYVLCDSTCLTIWTLIQMSRWCRLNQPQPENDIKTGCVIR